MTTRWSGPSWTTSTEDKISSEVLGSNIAGFLELSEPRNLDPLKAQVEDSAIQNLAIGKVVEMSSLVNTHSVGVTLAPRGLPRSSARACQGLGRPKTAKVS